MAIDIKKMSFKQFVQQINENADFHHIGSTGPFHPTKGTKKIDALRADIDKSGHKAHVRLSGSPAMVHLHVHKDHKNHPEVKKLISKFHNL